MYFYIAYHNNCIVYGVFLDIEMMALIIMTVWLVNIVCVMIVTPSSSMHANDEIYCQIQVQYQHVLIILKLF